MPLNENNSRLELKIKMKHFLHTSSSQCELLYQFTLYMLHIKFHFQALRFHLIGT